MTTRALKKTAASKRKKPRAKSTPSSPHPHKPHSPSPAPAPNPVNLVNPVQNSPSLPSSISVFSSPPSALPPLPVPHVPPVKTSPSVNSVIPSHSPVSSIAKKIAPKPTIQHRPLRATFESFLLHDAHAPSGNGIYGPYTFTGREALLPIVRVIDTIINRRQADAIVCLAGGAQFGKTILELHLAAYATSQPFLNFGLFLPDVNLVAGVIDTKFRPDVVDQIGWFSDMVHVGRSVNKSGKAVDRKGAFMVTDGQSRSTGMALGLQKVPTTFTFDIAALDEVDDIPERNAKFVRGRLTSSQLRLILKIGTQRIHGRGQNQAWKDGSQGIVQLVAAVVPNGGAVDGINPEESFPGIIRCALTGTPHPTDPKLTWAGDFRHDEEPDAVVATHQPTNVYYLAHPVTGTPLDRSQPTWIHRRPERLDQRNWSFRLSQLSIGAIGLSQIVSQFQLAVKDPEEMTVFRCDVLALPQSTAQAITPHIVERAQTVAPFDLRPQPVAGRTVFAGIDTGDRCYFFARERETAACKRLIQPVILPAGDLVARGQALFHQFGVQCLFIDQRPLVSQARTLALVLNGLAGLEQWPAIPASKSAWLGFSGGLAWDGPNARWKNLRCAVVRFDKKQIGAGVEHGFDVFEENGQTKFVPLIRCNRYETIDRAVRELLTPDESIVEVIDGKIREIPALLLPRRDGSKAMEEVEAHLITGSERTKQADGTLGEYVDQCANHFLLADAYSALAETEGGTAARIAPFLYESLPLNRASVTQQRFARRTLA